MGLLMALCAAAALAYAYMNEAQANQQLRAMLKVVNTQHAACMRCAEKPISRWPASLGNRRTSVLGDYLS